MNNKVKVNIPGFGERSCSNNIEYKLYDLPRECYVFYKKGTNIRHNEYGSAIEYKDTGYSYWINNKFHRLNKYAYNFMNDKEYYVIGKLIGNTKKKFIQNLANVLIPKDRYCL